MFSIPVLLTIYAGFTHAFEADHLLAVSNIVSGRNTLKMSLKDGAYWGLGHASTIFVMGLLIIIFKAGIDTQLFNYLEAAVGIMLITLAVYRLVKFFGNKKMTIHPHTHLQVQAANDRKQYHPHALAYGVGMIHGLAGSGALILIVLAQTKSPMDGIFYLSIFALGCIAGMMLASGLFSVPFSKKIMTAQSLQAFLTIASSVLCILYGGKMVYEHLV